MKLSDNFSLNEFTKSQTALRNGIDNTPSEEVIENLKALCENVLQPIREYFLMPVFISSGYRSAALNHKLGSSISSQHVQGQAADIEIHAKEIMNLRSRLNQIYVKHSGKKLADIESLMDRDTFISPEDAVKLGLIDKVVNKRDELSK